MELLDAQPVKVVLSHPPMQRGRALEIDAANEAARMVSRGANGEFGANGSVARELASA